MQALSSSPQRPADVHYPLCSHLFNLASGVTKAYLSDLGHDAVMLSRAKTGDCFLWAPRSHGTDMRPVDGASIAEAIDLMRIWSAESTQWYFLRVTDGEEKQGLTKGTCVALNMDMAAIAADVRQHLEAAEAEKPDIVGGFKLERLSTCDWRATDTDTFNRWPTRDGFATRHDAASWAQAAHDFKTGRTMAVAYIDPRKAVLADPA